MPQLADDRASHTLTVHRVAQQLADAGVPRSERRIKHFCQIGTLVAKKFPTPTGPQWFIDPTSVPGVIGDLKQFHEQIRSRLQHAAADHITVEEHPQMHAAAAGNSVLEQAAAEKEGTDNPKDDGGLSQPAASPFVAQLQKRIEEKDAVIGILKEQLDVKDRQITQHSERERETNILIRGLQNLVLQLQPGRRRTTDVFDDDPIMRGRGGVDNSAPMNEPTGV